MANLFDYFSPLFMRGLQLTCATTGGETEASATRELRDTLLAEVNAAEGKALADGKRTADVEQAVFALVAWIDETLQVGIQGVKYGIQYAGNEFFKRLNALSRQQDEVREVYYTALCLGFSGQYYFEVGDEGELGRIRESLSRQLPQAPASLAGLGEERITPQPYSLQDPAGPRLPSRTGEKLLRAAKWAALLIPLIALPFAWPVGKPPPEPVPSAVEKIFTAFQCAALAQQFNENTNTVSVTGRVENDADRALLQQRITELPQHPKVDAQNVSVIQWPFCEVMVLLDPFAERNAKSELGLAAAPSQHHPTTFRGGEDLILDVQAPKSDASYVYVDYWTKDKNVVHLLPNSLQTNNLMGKSSVITIGRGREQPGTRFWTMQAPFGTEMITVTAFPRPLFPQARTEAESADVYVKALREALAQSGVAESLAASYFFIESHP